jgi:hypothetical protein
VVRFQRPLETLGVAEQGVVTVGACGDLGLVVGGYVWKARAAGIAEGVVEAVVYGQEACFLESNFPRREGFFGEDT